MIYSYFRLEKIYLKASLKCVPGFGWAMWAGAYIFIQRKWKDGKSYFKTVIFVILVNHFSSSLFPEGTDLIENSMAWNNKFVEKNGLQKYEYVLYPKATVLLL